MKKLVFDFLDRRYPNLHIKKTKFGLLPVSDGENFFGLISNCEDIEVYFSCDRESAEYFICEWLRTKPLVENILNSTNESVLVHSKTELRNSCLYTDV